MHGYNSGALFNNNTTGTYTRATSASADEGYTTLYFNASRSNSIYGNSNTVQPPAVKLLPCIKAYSDVDNLGSCDVAQLENYVQNNVVHKTGDETVSGIKTFTNALLSNGGLHVKKSGFIKGSTPSNTQYLTVRFCDSTGIEFKNALGQLETTVDSNGLTQVNIRAIKNEANSTESANIFLGIDENNIKYAIAPNTSNTRTNPTDILTRDWIPQDTRIVHTTGDETISGTKNFSALVASDWFSFEKNAPYFFIINSSMSKDSLPSSNLYSGMNFAVKSQHVLNRTQIWLNSDGSSGWATSCKAFDNLNTSTYSATFALYLNKSGSSKVAAVSNVTIFRPDQNNAITLGTSSNRWKEVWTNASAINSSDERIKSSIESFPDNVLDAWGEVDFCQFKFNDAIEEKGEENARIHGGLVAQRIDSIFKNHNLDISRYGLFCYDEWDSESEIKDDEGSVIREASEAGSLYSIRYTEALCMEAAYQRRRADRAEARIKALEERLSLVESKLNIS